MNGTRLRESYWPADTTRPILDLSIGEALDRTALAVPDRIALIEVVPSAMPSPVGASGADRQWTYAQLQDDARRCAGWLLQRFETGDRICVWAPNVPEWVVLQYGAALAGIVLVTANPAFKPSELEFVLRQSKSSALFHLTSFRGVDTGAVARDMEKTGVRRFAFDGWLDQVRRTKSQRCRRSIRGIPRRSSTRPARRAARRARCCTIAAW